MITVEAVLCLIPFMLMIMGIISMINVFMVHNRIQYAMYETGSEFAAYTYLYSALGIYAADRKLNEDIDKHTEPVDTAITQVTDFVGQVSELKDGINALPDAELDDILPTLNSIKNSTAAAYNTTKSILETGKDFAENPGKLIRGIAYLGIEAVDDAAKNLLLQIMVSGLMNKYLRLEAAGEPEIPADAYLRGYDVKDGMEGLDFGRSTLFPDAKNVVNIVVEYDVELFFFKLFLKDPYFHVVQRVEIPAWLDGDGVHYQAE